MTMANRNDEYYDKFTKEIFETIKSLKNDDRGEFIVQTYENLFQKLKEADSKPAGVSVDMAKLREDLANIRGIGGQRLDEIMAVIERHLSQPASGEEKDK